MNTRPAWQNKANNNEPFDSVAWLLAGWSRTIAGHLAFHHNQLAFANQQGNVEFCVPVSGIQLVWTPWYYFGGGLKLKMLAKTYRITFVHPNDQPSAGGWRQIYGATADHMNRSALLRMFPEFAVGRELTRRWLALLNWIPIRPTGVRNGPGDDWGGQGGRNCLNR